MWCAESEASFAGVWAHGVLATALRAGVTGVWHFVHQEAHVTVLDPHHRHMLARGEHCVLLGCAMLVQDGEQPYVIANRAVDTEGVHQLHIRSDASVLLGWG